MADILISDLSNGTIQTVDSQYVWDGTGIFDRLMMAVNGNIKVEFDNGHITTTAYAEVYLKALQSAIAASMDFLLREKLIEEQIAASAAATIRDNAQSTKELLVKDTQIAASKASTIRDDAQATKELLVKDTQIAANIAGTDKLTAETDEVAANATKQRAVLDSQIALYMRQKAGFDDNKHQKILDSQLSAWGITFQDTDTTFLPSQLNQEGFTTSFAAVRANYYAI